MRSETCQMDPFRLAPCADDLPLAGWYGEPMDEHSARDLLQRSQQALREAYTGGGCSFGPQLQLLLARFWLRGELADAAGMLATRREARELALLELVQGQLLISVRLRQAREHLDAGFRAAAHLLSPEGYFSVLKRHEQLRALPLSDRAMPARGLAQLLTEAGVIRRLQGTRSERPRTTEGSHLDTLD